MTSQPINPDNRKIQKRSVKVAGHATSVSLEKAFWNALKEIASTRSLSLNELIGEIDRERSTDKELLHSNLSSAIRLFVLENRHF